MTCEHLIALERAIANAGFNERFRGTAWSQNCGEWVYFDCVLPAAAVRRAFNLAGCVRDHSFLGTHDGQESGFVCEIHKDAVMGYHQAARPEARRFIP